MEIVDLSAEYEASYFRCLEDWSDEIDAAGDHKETWYRKMTERGLRVKLALDDQDRPIGMIQYVPIEHSMAIGSDLYMILCVWVHGYKKGVGDHQGHGIGTALLTAAERDVAELGAKGVAAWGIAIPWWMRASWFKKHGYRTAAIGNQVVKVGLYVTDLDVSVVAVEQGHDIGVHDGFHAVGDEDFGLCVAKPANTIDALRRLQRKIAVRRVQGRAHAKLAKGWQELATKQVGVDVR